MNAQIPDDFPYELTRHGMQDIVLTLLDSLSAIKHLSEISCHADDEKTLIKQALTTLIQNQDMERCSFFMLSDDGLLSNVTGLSIAELGNDQEWQVRPTTFRIGEGVIGAAAASGCIQHCQNCQEDMRMSESEDKNTLLGSIISAPVFTLHHQLIGVLNVSHPEPYYFSDWHVRLLEVYKNVLGQLITNRRLFRQMEMKIAARTADLEQLVEETKRLKDHYASMSMQDQLTGLHNRRYFYNQVEIAIAYHKRYQSPFCLLVMDIDHFKKINDEFGHVFGDQVLISVADTLRHLVRSSDILVRFGGEEFVVIFINTSCQNGKGFAERIRAEIKALEWKSADTTVKVTMSIGLHCTSMECCETEQDLDIDQVIHCADLALYKAKESGRDKVVMYEESMRN
ncbi:sensor domain-containing diguanylate cyclase [Methylomonas sp. AM2-LC]|uniref:sensor domain-containing diguanylate cyclase n=1 Tax=Methylomonas sp. AM2-LC TaxID=3153301 RepID=UPI0032670416